MPSALYELWNRIRFSGWYMDLPPWLQEWLPFMVASLLLVLVTYFLVWLGRLLRRGDSVSRQLRREIRQLKREGDLLGVGQRYETLGEEKKALAAYRRGGLHTEYVELLLRLGERDAAKQAAHDGEVWAVYGELCRDDGEHTEAGQAYERAGKLYDAARAWEAAGRILKAAHCYAAVGMESNSAQLLMHEEGSATAEALEGAIRSSISETKGRSMSPDMARAVERCAQLWLAENDAGRAYRLAVDAERWEVAAPIARDYLSPDAAMIEVCLRAGAYLAAAEIAKKLGDRKQEALYRGEHYERHDSPAEAASWFEAAESWSAAAGQWAAAGKTDRAADLYAKAEEFEQAAQLYAAQGDDDKARAMRDAARAHDPRTVFEAEDKTRHVRPQAGVAAPAAEAATVGPPPPAPELAPALAERYQVEKEIGRGGMGVVYRAHDRMLDRTVAYKVLSTDLTGIDGGSRELLEEARAAARLSHPNIVQIYDAGPTAKGFFVVMEYVDGKNFAELLQENRLSVAGVAAVGRQICSALAHAHERRIVHRDIKPSNLMWTSQGQVKLTDFGLARVIKGTMDHVVTRAAGTPYYMAPEQIRGEAVDARTDLYSLGCVLFEMLCNRTPFSGSGSSIHHHLNSLPEDPRTSRREIPADLSALVLECLEKDPERRPASAADVEQRLAAFAAA